MNIGKYFPEKRHLSSTSDDGEVAKKKTWKGSLNDESTTSVSSNISTNNEKL